MAGETQGSGVLPLQNQSDVMKRAITDTLQCALVAEETLQWSMETGGAHTAPTHLRLLRDCNQICHVAADFMTRESEYADEVCSACADVCEGVAAGLEEFDEQQTGLMQEIALRVADECREAARSMAA